MEMYIKSTQYQLWNIITFGDIPINGPEEKCSLTNNKYNKICKVKIAKEIWDSLFVNQKGTKYVKLRKVFTLMRHYENLSMKEGETINDMFGRLQVLLNGLEAQEHVFTNAQINLKVLDIFPKVWEPKTLAIQEVRDMTILSWDELLGVL